LNSGGLWALFGSSFLASTLLPGGSELVFLYSHAQAFASPLILLMVATLGNTLGGLSNWGIGWYLKHHFLQSTLEKPTHKKALQQIDQWGSPLLLLSWLPIIGDPLCLAAGWVGIRLRVAVLFISVGKFVRYVVLLNLAGSGDL
jgi:membrane protein YqaA with SNARE-associated domain